MASAGTLQLDTCVLNDQQGGGGDGGVLWTASLTFAHLNVRSQYLMDCTVELLGKLTAGATTAKVVTAAAPLVQAPAPAPTITASGCWASYLHYGDVCQPSDYIACGFTCVGRECGVEGKIAPNCTGCPPLPYIFDKNFDKATATCTPGIITHHPAPTSKQKATGCYLVGAKASGCTVERLRFCGFTCNTEQLCGLPTTVLPFCRGCEFPPLADANATLSLDLEALRCVEPPDVVLESGPGTIKSSAFSTGIVPTPIVW